VYIIEMILSLSFSIVIWTKFEFNIKDKKWCIIQCFKWNILNRMHIIILSQVGWLGGKKIDFHPWGSRINFHKWHGLWFMVWCWLNIPYLHSQLRLNAYQVNLSRHNS
jgi:hypothetical protein